MQDNFKNTIEQIQSRINIAEIVSGYIPLKKAGANFRAHCPFHQEKTPSFMVSPGKQIYHCFGCGAGGDAISFVMEYEKVEFVEALGILAQKAGVELPQFKKGEYVKRASASNQLHRVNEMAVSYYNAILIGSNRGADAREYLKTRGINAKTVSVFKLGFAPDMWDGLLNYAKRNHVSQESLLKAGLIIPGKENSFYDRFRNRIIFPIFNAASKVVGFGARVLDETMPKYLNSPETEIYIKGRHLYGLNVASNEIRQKDEVIIVEGYLDLIIPYQSGIKNIVATLGTALTAEQINLIKRYTRNVVVIFDSDEAGEAASLRSLDILIAEGLNVRLVTLPKGHDPDSYVMEKGTEDLRKIVDAAKGLFDYKLDILLGKHGKNRTESKARIVSEMLPTIKRMENEILRSDYIKKLSQTLLVDEKAIFAELKKVKLDYTQPVTGGAFRIKKEARAAEKIIAALTMEDAEIANRIRKEFDIQSFVDTRIRKIIDKSFSLLDENKQPTAARLIHCINDEQVSQFICHILAEVESIVDREKTIEDCIKWLKVDNLRIKKQELACQIKEAEKQGNSKEVMILVKEFNTLGSVSI